MEIYYTVYKVTNQVNGKIYIGSHKTRDLDDGYMGSGKYLNYSIEKHGLEKFKKEILFVFDNPDDMFIKEGELVNKEFVAEENTYNLKVGGFGGFDYVNSKNFNNPTHSSEHSLKMTKRRNEIYSKEERIEWSKLGMKALRESGKSCTTGFKGKKHSIESKQKMKSSSFGKQKGERNSQFGTVWITNGKHTKKMKNSDPLPLGWSFGKKLKE